MLNRGINLMSNYDHRKIYPRHFKLCFSVPLFRFLICATAKFERTIVFGRLKTTFSVCTFSDSVRDALRCGLSCRTPTFSLILSLSPPDGRKSEPYLTGNWWLKGALSRQVGKSEDAVVAERDRVASSLAGLDSIYAEYLSSLS
jgi:hypothetical protein